MSDTIDVPLVVQKLMKTSSRLASMDVDKERLCYLVSDREWRQICDYVSRFEYREWLPDEKVKTMHFSGLEVIKRSAVSG